MFSRCVFISKVVILCCYASYLHRKIFYFICERIKLRVLTLSGPLFQARLKRFWDVDSSPHTVRMAESV